jgi:D-beta-D-heptose 7-phosphate kinase/D-beta-D-heptose 1-phosphate adenosyltransferase
VAINSDDSVRRLKGDARPIQNEHVRAHVLAALEMVDAVILFEEDTPLTCIEHILPNVLIKGADYTKAQVVGGDIVCQQGGRIFLADLKHGFSTTRTVEKMRD